MADVITYKGARYIPIFADPAEWDNTRAYEYMTLVMHEGNSYISKTNVPTGIDISNEDYWLLTANYNAQVEQYRQEVQAFDGRITANADAITAETTAREQAITAETTAREQADTTLQANIDAEKTAREQADTTLQANIDAEKTAREQADTTLQANIDAETSAREQAVTALQREFQTEKRILKGIQNQAAARAMRPDGYYFEFSSLVTKNYSYSNSFRINKAAGSVSLVTGFTVGSAGLSNNDVIITGLPKPGQSLGLGLPMLVIASNGNIGFQNITIETNGNVSVNGSISAGSNCYLIMEYRYEYNANGEGYTYEYCTPQQAANAANFAKQESGITYTNNASTRLDISAKQTDCSGFVWQCYKKAGFSSLPVYSMSQAGFGKVIDFAEKGENLNVSNVKAGDLLLFKTSNQDFDYTHVAIFTEDGGSEAYETGYGDGRSSAGVLYPQIINNPSEYCADIRARMILRYARDY